MVDRSARSSPVRTRARWGRRGGRTRLRLVGLTVGRSTLLSARACAREGPGRRESTCFKILGVLRERRNPDTFSCLSEAFLEPVLRVRLVVEGVDFQVAGRSVQGNRLAERFVGLQPHDTRAFGGCA